MSFSSKASYDTQLMVHQVLHDMIQWDEENEMWGLSVEDEDDHPSIIGMARMFDFCKEDDDNLAKMLWILMVNYGESFLELADVDEADPKARLLSMSLDLISKDNEDVGGD